MFHVKHLFSLHVLTMNMIVCDKDCTHQTDGYCCLNKITSLTASDLKCGYYEAKAAAATKPASALSAKDAQRLPDSAHRE